MKTTYPDYKKKGVDGIEKNLSKKDKKIFEDYLVFASSTAGKRKLADYRLYFLQFIDIMEKPLDKLKPEDIIAFAKLLNHDETRSAFTKNNIKMIVKRFLRNFYDGDLKMEKALKSLKASSQLINEQRVNKNTLLKDEEIEAMVRSAENWKLRACFVTAYESACRPVELRTARWKQIDWDKKTITLYSGKTKKARTVPLNEAITHLKRWEQEFSYPNVSIEDYIFPSNTDRNKPVIECTFRYWIEELGRKAGIKRTVNPYLLRHSRITELKTKGVDDMDRKIFSGHSLKSKMQSVYVHMDDADMIKSVISKVFHVEEMPEKKKHALEEKIDLLTKQNRELAEGLAKMGSEIWKALGKKGTVEVVKR